MAHFRRTSNAQYHTPPEPLRWTQRASQPEIVYECAPRQEIIHHSYQRPLFKTCFTTSETSQAQWDNTSPKSPSFLKTRTSINPTDNVSNKNTKLESNDQAVHRPDTTRHNPKMTSFHCTSVPTLPVETPGYVPARRRWCRSESYSRLQGCCRAPPNRM